MTPIWMTAIALSAVRGIPATPATHRPGNLATLQKDADALLSYGAPGVLAEVDTGHGDIRVRSG